MNVWRGVIVLCLYELSAAFPADLERQPSNIVLVGDDTASVDLDVIEGKQQRNGMYILGAIGQGIGGILGSWLNSLANSLGIVLEGVSTSLVTLAPDHPVHSPHNAVTEPTSDIIKAAIDNEITDVNVTSVQPPESQYGDYPQETRDLTQTEEIESLQDYTLGL